MALAVMFSFAACSEKNEKADPVKDSQTETAGEAGTEEAVAEENAIKEGKNAGTKVEGPYFIFIDDGTTISGLTEEGKKQTVLVIPERAKSLEGLTFSDSAVEEVSFASDHDIGLGTTFTVAKNIKKVTLPAELSVISFAAFGGCDGIGSITIPAGVTKIDKYAFNCCSNLKEVIFEGSSCKSIEAYAFEMCGLEVHGWMRTAMSRMSVSVRLHTNKNLIYNPAVTFRLQDDFQPYLFCLSRVCSIRMTRDFVLYSSYLLQETFFMLF